MSILLFLFEFEKDGAAFGACWKLSTRITEPNAFLYDLTFEDSYAYGFQGKLAHKK